MATVTGITVERAEEIEAASVVSGSIDEITGHLMLTKAGGAVIDAGLVIADLPIGGTKAEYNAALSDGDFASQAGAETLTNKTVALGSNTISGTKAQFNTAMTDDDFATLAGAESLTNKTLVSPVVQGVGEVRFIRKTVSETVLNSTVFQDDDELFFSVVANGVYVVDLVLLWEASVGESGIKVQWSLPSGIASSAHIMENGVTELPASYDSIVIGEASTGWGINTKDLQCRGSSTIQVGVTGGTVSLQWAQRTAHATNTRVRLNSWLMVRRVA